MLKSILGTKVGMTCVFDKDRKIVPVTVIQAGPCYVIRKKEQSIEGYNSLQIGFGEKKKVNRPDEGYFKKYGVKPLSYLKEFRVENHGEYQIGQEIKADIFSVGDIVDISGITKGKGLSGVMKRYGFGGGPHTHGQSDRARARGASGSQRPQRVMKGTRMAGRMGNENRTIQGLKVIKVDPENNLLVVKGSVPGVRNSLLVIKQTVKSVKANT